MLHRRRDRLPRSVLAAFLLLAGSGPAAAIAVVDPGQGPVALADPAATAPRELSGLTYDPVSGAF